MSLSLLMRTALKDYYVFGDIDGDPGVTCNRCGRDVSVKDPEKYHDLSAIVENAMDHSERCVG